MAAIPQRDGTVRRFPQSAVMEAFTNLYERMGTGEGAPPEHPLIGAARNSSDLRWSESFLAMDAEGWTDPIPDQSE